MRCGLSNWNKKTLDSLNAFCVLNTRLNGLFPMSQVLLVPTKQRKKWKHIEIYFVFRPKESAGSRITAIFAKLKDCISLLHYRVQHSERYTFLKVPDNKYLILFTCTQSLSHLFTSAIVTRKQP